jgi:dolichol-phosphate mannosyltransferase
VLPLLLARLDDLLEAIGETSEVVMVDDGSHDRSGVIIAGKAEADARYRYVALSRNFGHQNAITAGMELARGDAVVVMDADLQDPPEIVLTLLERWHGGYDIVHAKRRSRAGDSWFKRCTASLFYRIIRKVSECDLPADVGDFRLISRRAIETFRAMPEQDRYVRGMFGWMGYPQSVVEFDRDERAGGSTKYPFTKMARLACNGLIGFSDAPLRFVLWVGAIISVAALLYGAFVAALALMGSHFVSGWASLAVLISALSGFNMLMTGIVGLYVGRTYREVKGRPLYVVARDTGSPVLPLGLAELQTIEQSLAR